MASILLLDENETQVTRIWRLLFSKGHQVTISHWDPKAMLSLQQLPLDLAVLDLASHQGNGIAFCRLMRADPALMPVPILFLTDSVGLPEDLDAFNPDADDCLREPFRLEEIELRVEALLKRFSPGGSDTTSSRLQVGPLALDLRTYAAMILDLPLHLTPMEFALVRYLMYYAGEVISSQRLLREVWRYRSNLGTQELVRVHIRNLRMKIRLSSLDPYRIIKTVPHHGYLIPRDLC